MVWFIGTPVALPPGDPDPVPSEAHVRPLLPPDRHVTVVFLGNVPDDTAQAGWQALPELSLPAEASAQRWARFGRSALALELADDDGRWEDAAVTAVEAVTSLVTVRSPSPFRPHVTMARVPRRAKPPTASALARWALPIQPLRVGPLTLFHSAPSGSERRYVAVEQR